MTPEKRRVPPAGQGASGPPSPSRAGRWRGAACTGSSSAWTSRPGTDRKRPISTRSAAKRSMTSESTGHGGRPRAPWSNAPARSAFTNRGGKGRMGMAVRTGASVRTRRSIRAGRTAPSERAASVSAIRSAGSSSLNSTSRWKDSTASASLPGSSSMATRIPSPARRRRERENLGRQSTASCGATWIWWSSTRGAGTFSTTSRTGSVRALPTYAPEALDEAIRAGGYPLQYLIYLVALHRYLATRLPEYDYARHVGGAFYLFVRGIDPATGMRRGVYFHRPSAACLPCAR